MYVSWKISLFIRKKNHYNEGLEIFLSFFGWETTAEILKEKTCQRLRLHCLLLFWFFIRLNCIVWIIVWCGRILLSFFRKKKNLLLLLLKTTFFNAMIITKQPDGSSHQSIIILWALLVSLLFEKKLTKELANSRGKGLFFQFPSSNLVDIYHEESIFHCCFKLTTSHDNNSTDNNKPLMMVDRGSLYT